MSSEGTRVYVGGLIEDIKKEDLEREFEKFGKLNSVWVALNPPGFAFIEFENREEAEEACNAMDGFELLGATLKVQLSRKRDGPRRGPGRGGRGGNFRGRGSFGGPGGGRSYGNGGGGRPYNRDGFRSRSPLSRF